MKDSLIKKTKIYLVINLFISPKSISTLPFFFVKNNIPLLVQTLLNPKAFLVSITSSNLLLVKDSMIESFS